jgi:inner membrane protein
MNKSLFFRLLAIGLLMLTLLIPIALIRGVVSDRANLQNQVENTIAETSAGPQRFAGPLLIVPYIERELVITTDDKKHEKRTWEERSRHMIFVPTHSEFKTKVGIEQKYKGLYKALVFQSRGSIAASFDVPANLGLDVDPSRITVGTPFLSIGLTDVRGLSSTPEMIVNGRAAAPRNGTNFGWLATGLHAFVERLDTKTAQHLELNMKLDFAGTQSLSVAPIGRTTKVSIESPWPHPNFSGRFSPGVRNITDAGFSAQWEVSQLASRNGALIGSTTQPEHMLEAFSVSFVEPVNIYLQAERAVKYGVLFVALTFAAFFVFETLKNLRIHPLQYGLVGLALAIFFLLLVSLSEHVKFVYAYLSATVACVTLIAYYLGHVLGGWRRGFWFGVKLTVLYGVLYGLLLSEDNALMLGSLLLFVVLAAIMFATRRVNWYGVGTAHATKN